MYQISQHTRANAPKVIEALTKKCNDLEEKLAEEKEKNSKILKRGSSFYLLSSNDIVIFR